MGKNILLEDLKAILNNGVIIQTWIVLHIYKLTRFSNKLGIFRQDRSSFTYRKR